MLTLDFRSFSILALRFFFVSTKSASASLEALIADPISLYAAASLSKPLSLALFAATSKPLRSASVTS